MKRLIELPFFLIFVLCFQSCNGSAELKKHSHSEENKQKGYYTYGHEVNSFQPCGREGVFWVRGSGKNLQILEKRYMELTSQPYEEVYVEIIGEYMGKAKDGFAVDYDGQIRVKKLIHMRDKANKDCNKDALKMLR